MKESFFLVISLLLSTASYSQKRGFAYATYLQVKDKYSTCFDSTKVRKCEKAAEHLSFIGLNRESLATYNICHPTTYSMPEETGRSIEDYKPIDAEKHLLHLSEDRQVVMINENHSSPQHRLFTANLLKGLKKRGFTHLGLEGLRDANLLKEKGYPTKRMGYYVADPQYANMIREALKLGFTIFDYDTSRVSVKIRELTQAKRIAKVLSKNPDAKIIIHAGGGHIREDTTYYGGLMAYQFKKLTGIDPLTINQTRMNEQSSTACEHPFYASIKNLPSPSFMQHRKTKNLYSDSASDLILFHPRTRYKKERPSWLYNNKRYHRKRIKLEDSLVFPILILVFPTKDKDILTVPSDAIELHKKNRKALLFFPEKGKYDVAILEGSGKKIIETIEIK
ncbi:hypothetical protein [Aureispira sp. CCB-QB1]|uniref:hypothetical protein n=1 Tax=Aureispira sp. CCB-QB1 TaxID=1313421 RepID=UPI00069915F5|nr:hypothetical protein [Aureispira sp. CCB-QB1]